jgi:hypothetical protein
MAYSKPPEPLGARIARRLEVTPACWLWRGADNGAGYGQVAVKHGGKWMPRYVHRLVFEALVAPIPDGLTLDHLCRNTRCANPAHLAVVTGTENIRRGSSPAMVIARSGKCAQGHPRDPQNVRQRADGHLRCVPCSRQYAARRRRERKAA